MKMYQKILIGIAAGFLFGAFLGPQSLIFTKDTLQVVDPSKVTVRATLGDPSSQIVFAQNLTTDFAVKAETTFAGETWYEATWQLSAEHLVNGLPSGIPADALGAGEAPKPGAVLTVFVREDGTPPRSSRLGLDILSWVTPVGEIFLRLILMLVVPMIFTSLTVGVASVGNVRYLGRLGFITVVFFLGTSSVAILIGVVLASLFSPGSGVTPADAQLLAQEFNFLVSDLVSKAKTTPDLVRFIVEIVPDNPLHSMASESPNLLQVMFFAIMFGVALTLIPKERSRQVVSLLDKASQVLTMVMHIVMRLAPIGVACLIAQTVGVTGFAILPAMGIYILVVVLALAIHCAGVLSVAVRYLTPVSVKDFWKAIWPALLMATGTSSSAASLPVTLRCAEDNLGISNRVSSFAIPLGATINMDGTALFQGVAAVFIAQAFGIDLPFSALVTVFITALLASIGTAAVPGSGLVSLALVLSAVGLPPAGIGLVIGFDRMLDMLRTPVNVASDLVGSLVVARFAGEHVNLLLPDEDVKRSDKGFEHRLDVAETPYDGEDSDPST